jgi:uncharacterized protein YndB with AHSA1/START domain
VKSLLTITAILEAATGLSLLAAPSAVALLLLGASLETPAAQAVARIAGAALLALGVACWFARHDPGGGAARGIIAGMLLYNCGVVMVLFHGAMVGSGEALRGVGLWPAAGLHSALGVWCIVCTAPRRPARRTEVERTTTRPREAEAVDETTMQNTGNLTVTTPSEREILFTRVLNAPRKTVWDAWTKPELLKRWLHGPDDWTLAVCDVDVRAGGALRWEWRGPKGERMAFSGVYREVTPPERIVHTEIFDEDWTGGETLVTIVLTERAGKTTVAMTVLYSSTQARDGALKSGMEQGMASAYDRVEEMLVAKAGAKKR